MAVFAFLVLSLWLRFRQHPKVTSAIIDDVIDVLGPQHRPSIDRASPRRLCRSGDAQLATQRKHELQ
ncbi:hypothetical protein ASC87_08310 [Rhizobacter sp. Root1221]|nr:hypothetical protein ASC87_08310 [Rhizobacter sp. Root1221]